MKTILIAIPTARYIEPDTFKSIYELDIPAGYHVTYQHFYGYRVDQVRNLIADWVVRGFDYLFSVDHDVTFPPDTLRRLLEHDVDLVSGVYRQRLEPQRIEIYDIGGNRMEYENIYGKPIVEIGGCGFGCVLVRKEVLKDVGYPQFEYHPALDHNNTISEDTDFCRKAREKNFTLWCDPSVVCGHIGMSTMHVEVPKIDPIQRRLQELHDLPLLAQSHVQYLADMKAADIQPKVVYDIGACVLHWTNRAKEVWPDATFIPFDAMKEVEFLYRNAGFKDFAVGCVLSDTTGKQVEFFQNLEHPGGNSLFEENPDLSPQAKELFPHTSRVKRKTNALDDIVKLNSLPKPDLIKMDVQGAELEVLRGARETLKTVEHLILELQHKDYNLGAPKAQEVIDYLDSIGFEMVGSGMFCGSVIGVDGDYHFRRKANEVQKAYIIRTQDPRSIEYSERLAESLEKIGLPYEFWAAHDHKTPYELWKHDPIVRDYNPTMVPPAASCTATHYDLWYHIASTGECAAILEHDMLMWHPIDIAIPDGVICNLGYKLANIEAYDHVAAGLPNEIISIPNHYGSHGYCITANTAKLLLEELAVIGAPVSIDASHFIRDDDRFASNIPMGIISPTPGICWLRESTIWCDGAQEINAPFVESFKTHLRQ